MEISQEDREVLEQLEEELWREGTRFDPDRMNALLSHDFFEFGRSGRVYQRQNTLRVTRQPFNAVLPLPDLQVRLLNADTAQVTYNSVVTYDSLVEYARRSSIWSRTPNGWVLRFHQGTPFHPV